MLRAEQRTSLVCKKSIARSKAAGWRQGTFKNLDPALQEEETPMFSEVVVSKNTAKEENNTKEEPQPPQQETNHPPNDNLRKAKPVSMENSTANWLELTFDASSGADFNFHASDANLENEASAEHMEPVVEQPSTLPLGPTLTSTLPMRPILKMKPQQNRWNQWWNSQNPTNLPLTLPL
jgi:hypothetical protein